ncbi:MAG: hypothetical protein QOI63_1770 [Thermoplasmata archaeon]|jgi:uncharacterized membrane protein|nr:hypothetical protein [Thermoplasmata archaeon]
MTRTRDGRPATAFPADLAAAFLALLGVVVSLLRLDPLRIVLGWPLPLLLPGYAILAWLFPARRSPERFTRALTGWERVGLGVVGSVAATALLGVALNFTPVGITLASMAYGLGLLTALFLVLALDARLRLPVEDRPVFAWGQAPDPDRPGGRTSPAMAALLAVSFAGMLTVLVLLFPKPAVDAYSNLYVLGDGDKAACLPDTYTPPGQPGAGFATHVPNYITCPPLTGHVTVGIVNHEARVVTYYAKVFWSLPTADPKASISEANVEGFSVQLGPVGPPGDKVTYERQYDRNVTLAPPPLSGLNRLNVHLYKDLGNGVGSEPDLLAYFYVNAP